MNLLDVQNSKNQKFGIDKNFNSLQHHFNTDSLSAWVAFYYQVHVQGAPEKTEHAKQKDINKFLGFYEIEVGHDHVDSLTPSVTKQFQRLLSNTISSQSNKVYKATTVNRILATIRHIARWLHKQRPFLAGDPFFQVKDMQTDASHWNVLTSRQLMRLKSACEQRIKFVLGKIRILLWKLLCFMYCYAQDCACQN